MFPHDLQPPLAANVTDLTHLRGKATVVR